MKAGVKRKLDSDQDRDDLVPTLTNVVSDYTPLLFLSTALKCETTSKLAKLTAFTKLRKKLYTRLFPVDSHNHYSSNAPVSTTATPHTSETLSSLDETPSVEPQYVNPEAPPSERVEIDPVMASRLKAHQFEGVRFMWKQVVSRESGCILAHSMGLGKTYQTITFVTTLLREISNNNENLPNCFKSKRVLIVSPVTVLANWVNEFSKWVPPNLESIVGHVYNYADIMTASKSRRLNYLHNWFCEGGILLMGYEAFRMLDDWKDQVLHERVSQYLFDPGPALVVADEGHRIKSIGAKVTVSLRKIKTPARVCLTGYPLQNNLQEYHTMIDFVCQGFLPPEEIFKTQYRIPIERDYQETTISEKVMAKKLLLTLQLLTADIVQRRTQDILQRELSPKTEYYIACGLSRTQYKLYLNILQDLGQYNFDRNHFYAVPILRSLCNHPYAFQLMIERTFTAYQMAKDTIADTEVTDFNDLEDEKAWQVFLSAIQSRLEKGMFAWTKEFFSELPDQKDYHHSCKMEVTSDIVKTSMQIGDKVVIVTHNIATLDYLEEMLPKVNNANVMRIDGQTPATIRQERIDNFNRDENKHVMLLSARAGSLGVNITSANRIILMDADWNPSHEEQSLGRVYRYGQTKPVFAYRLYTASTIEDYLLKQGLQKRRLASRLIDNTSMPAQEKAATKLAFRYPQKKFPILEQRVIDDIEDIVLQRAAMEQRYAFVDISLANDIEYQVDINDPDLSEEDIRNIRHDVVAQKKKYYQRLNYSQR